MTTATFAIPWSRSRVFKRIRPWHVVLLFTVLFTLIVLWANSWNPMVFVQIGERYDPTKSNQYSGYDGQFYYQIAKDPLTAWKLVDVPAYRYQRIIYPLLARVLSFGQAGWIPWVLILINLVAIPLGTHILERIMRFYDANRWYALIYGLFMGTLLSLRLDLAEPMAFLFILAAILGLLRNRMWESAFWFSAASLTRETTLLFAAGYFLYLIFQRKISRAVAWGLVSTLPFMAWHMWLRIWLGSWGIGSGGALSSPFEVIPFHGWWGMASTNLPVFVFASFLIFPLAVLPALFSFGVSSFSLHRRVSTPAVWSLWLNAAAFAFLPPSIFYEPDGLDRVTIGLVVAFLYFGAEAPDKRLLKLTLYWLIVITIIYRVL